jgi:lysophospholipase L1-like esterase
MSTKSVLAVAVLVVTGAGLLGAAERAPAKRIVCFGDSITKAGYPEVMAKEKDLGGAEVINAGVGGNTTAMALKRLAKDVIDQKPDVVVVFFGTNDCRLAEPQIAVPLEKYQANLSEIAQACEKAGAKVVICTLPPINEEAYFKRHAREKFDAAGGMKKVLADYRAAAIKAADALKIPVVDLNQLLRDRPEWVAADGVHPTVEGNKLIAREVARVVEPLLK